MSEGTTEGTAPVDPVDPVEGGGPVEEPVTRNTWNGTTTSVICVPMTVIACPLHSRRNGRSRSGEVSMVNRRPGVGGSAGPAGAGGSPIGSPAGTPGSGCVVPLSSGAG